MISKEYVAMQVLTFARFCLWAYFDKFNLAIFINGPSGCDNIDACIKNIAISIKAEQWG